MALNYTPLVQMLQHAALKLQYPSITVRTDAGQKIKIKLAAKGYLAIVLDGEYVGKIEKNGSLTLYQDRELVSTVLSEMVYDPYAFTKAQGLKYGFCCFCARELTDPQSVSVGYGPICAENFGLPWGLAEPEEVITEEDLEEAFQDVSKAPEVLGEAEQMLKDIDNAGLDLKIEGAKEMLTLLEGLYDVGVTHPEDVVPILNAFITQMENLRQ